MEQQGSSPTTVASGIHALELTMSCSLEIGFAGPASERTTISGGFPTTHGRMREAIPRPLSATGGSAAGQRAWESAIDGEHGDGASLPAAREDGQRNVVSPYQPIQGRRLSAEGIDTTTALREVVEIVFALSPTMEGDTTNFYIYKQIQDFDVFTSTIARGISVGDELEYADEITLGRSIVNRVPFEASLKS